MFSYHKEDFIIRQIQSAARALAKLFFNSETVSYTIKDESNYTQSDLIYLKIKELMEQHKYLEPKHYYLSSRLRWSTIFKINSLFLWSIRSNEWRTTS